MRYEWKVEKHDIGQMYQTGNSVVNSALNKYEEDGWELFHISSAVIST